MSFEISNLKITSSLVAAIVSILGGVWAIDSHYASAADVAALKQTIETQLRTIRQDQIEDEIFKLDVKRETQDGKLSPADTALHQRYTRRLNQTLSDQSKSDKLKIKE